MNDLLTLARRRGLVVIEDAAHAIPAAYRGRPVGGGTNPVAFSFYATKNLTTGEGGMLTGEPAFIEHARTVALHGMNRDAWRRYEKGGSWRYDVLLPGFKYNMSDIQAALGLWQLRRQPEFHRRRHEIAAAYNRAFAGEPALEEPAVRPWVDHAWHLYVLRLRPNLLSIDRDRFIEELTERQVGTSVHFIPVPLHPYYRDKYGYAPQDFPVAYDAYSRMLSLPIHPGLTDYDVADVVSAVLDVVARFRR
jgi:dTDP-4-amino-4,6-dideoxygalactose transaminase